jgi:hypothetical protein
MKPYYFWVLITIFSVACQSSKTALYSPEEVAVATKNLEEGNYTIELEWARPLNTAEMSRLYSSNMLPAISQSGQINILDSANFIKKTGDSLKLYLPYFGTRQISVNPADSNSAIRFEGVPENYQVTFNERKQFHTVTFKIRNKTEAHNVAIQIYPDQKVQVNLNSSHRTGISYTGKIKSQD